MLLVTAITCLLQLFELELEVTMAKQLYSQAYGRQLVLVFIELVDGKAMNVRQTFFFGSDLHG